MSRARFLGLTLLAALVAASAVASPAQAASRIVALTPFTANTVANLGVRPVAIGESLGGSERLASKLRGVRQLALSHPNGPNMEQLASLNPSLVLSAPVWHHGTPSMQNLGMKVVESDPAKVSDVPVQTRRIGALVGRAALGKQLAAIQTDRINVATRAAKRHPTVLVILGVGRTPYAFLASSWGGSLVMQAGGRLLTGGLTGSGGFARISNEVVVQRNPDVIIAVPHGDPQDIPKLTAFLRSNPAWKNTKAVRSHHLYVSTDNALLQAWTDVARSIYDVQTTFLKNR